MTKEQEQWVNSSISIAQTNLQEIVDGKCPVLEGLDLNMLRLRADWQLCYLLRELIRVLPESLRAQVSACYYLREEIWSDVYRNRYDEQQKEASPNSLTTTD